MIAPLRRMWAAAPVATTVLGLALALVLVFGLRLALWSLFGPPPVALDQPIAGWMTPRFVAMSWRIPPEVVGDALDLVRGEGRPGNLDQIARDRGVPVEDLIAELEAAIAAHRAAHPAPEE